MLRKMLMVLIVALVVACSFTNNAYAQTVANSFIFPLDNYVVNGLGWGGLNDNYFIDGLPGKHVAEDIMMPAGTIVKASANGKVMFARYHEDCPNWTFLIVIEHTLPDGTKKCTIYGHIEPYGMVEGQDVTQAEVIGEVAMATVCWNPHLHYAIYDGAYGAAIGIYPAWLRGYASQLSWPMGYLKPSEFTNPYLVAHFVDGTFNQAIKDCYDLHGGRDGPGYVHSDAGNPIYVHEWEGTGLLVQNFINAEGKESCIM